VIVKDLTDCKEIDMTAVLGGRPQTLTFKPGRFVISSSITSITDVLVDAAQSGGAYGVIAAASNIPV